MLSPEDAATLQAYAEGVHEARRETETKWGVGRVELLASDELRARWRRQCVTWRQALETAFEAKFLTRDQLQLVADKAGAMRRGYAALDAAAEEAGHRPIHPWVWEVMLPAAPNDVGGVTAAIVQTNAEASHVIAEGRYLVVYTLAEIGNVLAALPDALRLAKQVFPGSRFQAPRVIDRLGAGPWRPEGDDIPFGDAPLERELAPESPPPAHSRASADALALESAARGLNPSPSGAGRPLEIGEDEWE